ncbi:YesL family protein [Myceligenerans pegani]|uniref:YesL family protein n=1 Tax=Myceligenerans pegani TaxID=2776917 RepID=A0ABR9MU09_9MICO|nr:YesL family protein [Myceligenerans sp. TRM 65318]MBE1874862.1 YesL family protein [Myceligenerans sp. TRM 65318]MBE3017133.1 YesL family protein [Myceligenerans sp. TRM 65318]
MRIDPDSRSVQGLTTFLQFVVLNVLYIVACLPVVTAGAATAALYEVALRYADEERGYLITGFFVALRRNLWRGTAVGLLLGVPAAMAAFAAIFWLASGTALGSAAGTVAVLLVGYLVAALLYGLVLVARYADPLGRTLRNALLLPLAEPLRTLALLVRPAATVSLLYVFPPTVVLVATIGFSVGAYVDALVLHSVFRRRGGDPTALDPVSPHSGE